MDGCRRSPSPAALARTDLEPPAGLADTIPKPLAAAKEASTLDTGNIAEARMESEHARRMGALNNETFSEIERARLARGPDPLAAYGDDWMQEVSEIIDRVSRKHFPNGVPLD